MFDRAEDFQIVGNLVGKFLRFIGQLFAFHAGQALQPQIENGACLGLRQAICPVQNLMPGIINQRDKGLDLGSRPCLLTQLVARCFSIWRPLDQFNDLVDRGQRHHKASQHMRTFARFAQKMDRPFRDHFLAEITKGRDHVLQTHLHRTAGIHGQHIDRETGLQACVAIQLVQHHITRTIALDLDHHPHSGPV